MRSTKSFVNGEDVAPSGAKPRSIRSPYDGSAVTEAYSADAEILDRALSLACSRRDALTNLLPHERATILERLADRVVAEREEFAGMLRDEAGKPITLARIEADRCVETIRDAAHWCRQMQDEFLPLDGTAVGAHRQGIIKRFPVGLVSA
ncbi:MAG TPA: aldehyde dehydrogenase family protein, partial [Acidobacteriota bacterium]|nr:aldehyde dehydrogenase family protein [Acidobacteriota bacterium]